MKLVTLVVSVAALVAAAAGTGAASPQPPHVALTACKAGTVPATVGGHHVCLAAGRKCKARYERIYRKKGFHCASGRLHRIKPSTPPPPPPPPPPLPPPPPPAQAGHYKGTSSQLTDFEFDVTPDGSAVSRLVTGQINESCNGGVTLYGGDLDSGTATIPIDPGGSFKLDVTFASTVGSDPSVDRVVITGNFSGATATGTLLVTTSFTDQGTPYSCTSNPQTWTATRVG
jgi:hypothetical protein